MTAIDREKTSVIWLSGQTCSSRLVLVLSSFSTVSACTVDELVGAKPVTLVVGLNLSPEKGALSLCFQI